MWLWRPFLFKPLQLPYSEGHLLIVLGCSLRKSRVNVRWFGKGALGVALDLPLSVGTFSSEKIICRTPINLNVISKGHSQIRALGPLWWAFSFLFHSFKDNSFTSSTTKLKEKFSVFFGLSALLWGYKSLRVRLAIPYFAVPLFLSMVEDFFLTQRNIFF